LVIYFVRLRVNPRRIERETQQNHLPLNLLLHYLVKRKWSTIHRYIHISETSMLHARWHLFREFLFVYFFSWYGRKYDIIAIFCLLHYSFL